MSARRHKGNNMLDLFLSVANGSCEGLQHYLANSGSPDLQDDSNTSLLHKAVMENHLKKVQLLMFYGCHVNLADNNGCTAVHLAIDKGHHSILQTLLDAGACVNTVAFQHTTPLILAISKSDMNAVDMILTKAQDCDINMENYYFQTALSQAVISDSVEMCEILLKHGASVTSLYKGSFKTTIARTMCNDKQLMKLFLNHSKSLDLHYHLMMSCILKTFDVAECLLMEFENPFQLEGLGFITMQEDFDVWERLTQFVVKRYKLATKCSTDNQLLMMMLNFCKSKPFQTRRSNQKHRAASLIRILVKYGLVIHPQTKIQSCDFECECRKCIFTSLYEVEPVTSLKGQCCSVIRQNMPGEKYFEFDSVYQLPLPNRLKDYICMFDWK